MVEQTEMAGPAGHLAFLQGGGDLAHLVGHFAWDRTVLGPMDTWPQTLKTATSLLLRSRVPMVLLWGKQGVMIYNDGYAVIAGDRHPQLLGSEVRLG